MPIYEFRCSACRRRTSVFTRSVGVPAEAVCEHCGSSDLARVFSRVSVLRAGGDDYGGLDEASFAGVDENDPRSVAKWVRKMSRQMGEPLDAGMESELERMEMGEMPDDLGEDGADGEFAGLD